MVNADSFCGQGVALCMQNENNSLAGTFLNMNASVKDISALKIRLCSGFSWLFLNKTPQFLHNI